MILEVDHTPLLNLTSIIFSQTFIECFNSLTLIFIAILNISLVLLEQNYCTSFPLFWYSSCPNNYIRQFSQPLHTYFAYIFSKFHYNLVWLNDFAPPYLMDLPLTICRFFFHLRNSIFLWFSKCSNFFMQYPHPPSSFKCLWKNMSYFWMCTSFLSKLSFLFLIHFTWFRSWTIPYSLA